MRLRLLMVLFAGGLLLPIGIQAIEEPIVFEGGKGLDFSFRYPKGWKLERDWDRQVPGVLLVEEGAALPYPAMIGAHRYKIIKNAQTPKLFVLGVSQTGGASETKLLEKGKTKIGAMEVTRVSVTKVRYLPGQRGQLQRATLKETYLIREEAKYFYVIRYRTLRDRYEALKPAFDIVSGSFQLTRK